MAGGAGYCLEVPFGIGQPFGVRLDDLAVARHALASHVVPERRRLHAVGLMAVLAREGFVARAAMHAVGKRRRYAYVAFLARHRFRLAAWLFLGGTGCVRIVAVGAQRRLLAAVTHQRGVHAVFVLLHGFLVAVTA